MKVAIVGDGVVGRALANLMSDRAEVTVFTCARAYQRASRQIAGPDRRFVGLPWCFPTFASEQGSMPVWGGVLAIPSSDTMASFGVALAHDQLFSALVDTFELEHLYGRDFGGISHLFKASPSLQMSGRTTLVKHAVATLKEGDGHVALAAGDGSELGRFDYCFLATGAASVPKRMGDALTMAPPDTVYDKVISITPRDAPPLPRHSIDTERAVLSVPICIPASASRRHTRAVFHHIMKDTGLMSGPAVAWGYIANAPAFVEITANKLLLHNRRLWFSTWTGAEAYPLQKSGNRIEINQEVMGRFDGQVFMAAQHCDARLDPGTRLGQRVFAEHLDADAPPVSFNPVVLRFAKLYEKARALLQG